jgi:hypothetical protein
MSTNIGQLIDAEINAINRLFQARNVLARVTRGRTLEVRSSFISYGVQLARTESSKSVDALQRDLSNVLTELRTKLIPGYQMNAVVRVRDFPLALEVPHPAPTILQWQSAAIHMARFLALVGRSYTAQGPREEFIDLERDYHTLIAAMSGAGKSTMMRMGLCTLLFNTPTTELSVYLVDLKNDDLHPFRQLPHVVDYAGSPAAAADIIQRIYRIKEERIESRERPYRILLVIDELAELGTDKDALRKLGSILSTGRSLGINVWAGTQYPSADLISGVVNASFTVRIAGIVDGKTSANMVTKRAGSGAELLQLPGDFLRTDGAELRRMKGYNLSAEDTSLFVRKICNKWGIKPSTAVIEAAAAVQEAAAAVPAWAELVEAFQEFTDSTGQLRRGAISAILHQLYGDKAPESGNNYKRAVRRINEWHQEYVNNGHSA